jgi:hypothetical protein
LATAGAWPKRFSSLPAGLEFLKFEPAVFSRFALVPGVEAAFAATHYDEHTGMFRCLGGDDPVCCSKYGAVAAGSVAIAFFALSYSIAPRTPGMVGFDATVSKCPCPIHGRRILAGASYQDIKNELGVAVRTLALCRVQARLKPLKTGPPKKGRRRP